MSQGLVENKVEVIRIFITSIGFIYILSGMLGLSGRLRRNHICEIIITTHSLDFRD